MSLPRIYVYKIVVDNGGAPCVWRGVLSLAICKPKIRITAQEGDLVFGFGGKNYGERLIYVAEVTEKPSVGDYYRMECFANRPDCIYEDRKGTPYRKLAAKYHDDSDERKRDVGMKLENAYVLLSQSFRYFGRNGTDDYKRSFASIKNLIEGLKQGHRVNHSKQLRYELMALKDQVWLQHEEMVLGSRNDRDRTRLCNSNVPSVECS